ncbi:hypothetical protein HAX54_009730 [Datura stramonium]|uniref:Serine/threonine-protein kinase TOR n=1 Tax=Datura stramonium TaxID=4076 RepID=A0ABS8RWN8_DATST|nr:hypothetical protein [Datura stramonium]
MNFLKNMGALRVIDELIDVTISENASKVEKLSNYMRSAFETKCEPEFFVLASKVLGHLARSGGAMTADEVEHQVSNIVILQILDCLTSGISILSIFRVCGCPIWVAVEIRCWLFEKAVEALRACLRVIEKRIARMFEATKDGLAINEPVHSIHGSLLAVGELLRNTGEFMMSKIQEVAEIVLSYLEHQDDLVRLSITSLLPRIAHFLRDRFVTNYLTVCMNHILHVLKIPAERASGLIALGEMAGALDGELINYLPTIISHLRDAIAPQRGRPSLEAPSMCWEILLKQWDQPWSLMFVVSWIDWLLECISVILSRSHHAMSRQSAALSRGHLETVTSQVPELSGSALVQLALETLARFNFKGHDLLEFARESVVVYLEDEDGTTRKDAALCCCKLVANSFLAMSSTQFSPSRINVASGKRRGSLLKGLFLSNDYNGGLGKGKLTVYLVIVQKLLIAAVADADVTVRHSDFEVREYAISLAGRLSEKNPAYVLPALRRHLSQLLTYLESADNKCKEESAKLLGCLIRNCECLVLRYIAPIHKALVVKLCEGTGANANSGIISGVLVAPLSFSTKVLEELTNAALRLYCGYTVSNFPCCDLLVTLGTTSLLDPAAVTKREVAVSTLGQVVQSTGYVITPYNEYPRLLELLLKLLNGELAWSTRREVLKVLGIMGALDPHVHKRNQQSVSGSHGEVTGVTGDPGQHRRSMDELLWIWPSFATSEEYYSSVAINSLMRILRDPSLSSYHQEVVGSLMFIFKSMGSGCVLIYKGVTNSSPDSPCPSDPPVLPDLFHIVRTSHHKYLPELLSLISELWSSSSLPVVNRPLLIAPILHLVEQLCLELNDQLRKYLPDILPCCIQVLTDAERFNDYTYVIPILHTLEVFGGQSSLVFCGPCLVDASVEVRRGAIKTLTRLIPRVQVTGHISSLVHHLKLVLGRLHALGEDFTIFIPSIHKLMVKHRLQGRLEKHEPLIFESTTAQRLNRRLPVEVISDPLSDGESDHYEVGTDMHKQLRSHQPFVVRELFAAGFVSCWSQLNEASQAAEYGLGAGAISLFINLEAESMEHDERPLPIDIRLLGALAEKCRAFAKALHYKEMEFEGALSNRKDANPVAVVEALIHINNQLHQHEAAVGILTYAQQHLGVKLKESWYEKLQRWDDALKAYTAKESQASSPNLGLDATLGRMRCLGALARWEELNNLCKEYWTQAEPAARLEMAPMFCRLICNF